MKNLSFILLFLFCLISTSGFTQKRVQISLGSSRYQTSPSVLLNFSDTDNVEFKRFNGSVLMGSVLLLHELTPKTSLRYGLDLKGSSMSSKLKYAHEVDGQSESAYIVHDYHIMKINIPFDFIYEPNKWFYTVVGVYPTFRVPLSMEVDYPEGSLSLEETRMRIDQLKSHLARLGFNYRLGVGVRYKMFGLELTYEKLLTNSLKKEFTFNNVSYPTSIKYSSVFLKLTFHMIHSQQTFLDWDYNES